jgi:photosystem II stability/assembly factor-like uncharacterized protein
MTVTVLPEITPAPVALSLFVAIVLAGCSSTVPALQWESTGGPLAQNITSVHIDEDHPSTVVAALTSGELYESTDQGGTWARLGIVRPQITIFRLVQHPETSSILYASTDDGLFRSEDRGQTWKEITVASGTPGSSRALAIDPLNTNLMYAGIRGRGIFTSVDAGLHWAACAVGADSQSLGRTDVFDIVIDHTRPDIVYAALSGLGVVKSTDAGRSWQNITGGVTYPGAVITSIVLNPGSPEEICIGTDGGSIYRSTNGGAAWSTSRKELGEGVLSLTGERAHPQTVYAGTEGGVLVSTDFGASWKQLTRLLPRCTIRITVSPDKPDPILYAFGPGVGLLRSRDRGVSWEDAGSKLGGSSLSLVTSTSRGKRIYGAGGSALYRFEDPRGWTPLSDGLTGGTISALAFENDSSVVMLAGTLKGLFRTTDGGKSWMPAAPDLRFNPLSSLDGHPYIATRLIASSSRGILVSTDMGSTWSHSMPLDATYQLNRLTFSSADAGLIYGATRHHGVIVSTDGGLIWKEPSRGRTSEDVLAVTLDGEDPQTVYAWTSSGDGFRSTNRGLFWNHYLPPWKLGDTVCIAFDRKNPSDCVAIVNSRILYHSPSGGRTWIETPMGVLPGIVTSLFWDARFGMLYAGVRDRGVYRFFMGQELK